MDENLKRKIDEVYRRHQREKDVHCSGDHRGHTGDLVRALEKLTPFVERMGLGKKKPTEDPPE